MDISYNFKGKTVIITGAASGMGFCASEKYAKTGAQVLMCDINEDGLRQAAAKIVPEDGGSVEAYPIDMRDFDAVMRLGEYAKATYGHIDITVSFAGGTGARVTGEGKPFHQMSEDVINWSLDVNLRAPMYLARAVINTMIEQKSGVIINIGSVMGILAGSDADYAATKSGLIGFTKSLAYIGAPHGVRSVMVTPGGVMTRPGLAGFACPLDRVAEPEELVDVVMFASGDKASFITGENIIVDGGRTSCYPRG